MTSLLVIFFLYIIVINISREIFKINIIEGELLEMTVTIYFRNYVFVQSSFKANSAEEVYHLFALKNVSRITY